MYSHEEAIERSASPDCVWALFADVVGWKEWNSGIESIEIEGPFKVGTTFTMKPPGQDAIRSTLIDVKANESFTDETIVDDTRVLVKHEIIKLASVKTKIVYSTQVTGASAAEFGPMVTSDFPEVLISLKNIAEQRGSAA